jgi:hypothetical protein
MHFGREFSQHIGAVFHAQRVIHQGEIWRPVGDSFDYLGQR